MGNSSKNHDQNHRDVGMMGLEKHSGETGSGQEANGRGCLLGSL
jgi:hypothetical protein